MEAVRVTDIAERFVDLALKHDWAKVTSLPDDEVRALFDFVSAMYYETEAVVYGQLKDSKHDAFGDKTGEMYTVNDFCPFQVVSEGGYGHHTATYHLNDTLRSVVLGVKRERKDREQLIREIGLEIEHNTPLEPIKLTPEGDMLGEYPGSHARDTSQIGSSVHRYCNGWVDRRRATKEHDVLFCRVCCLRIYIPREIITYGDLRAEMAKRLAPTTVEPGV